MTGLFWPGSKAAVVVMAVIHSACFVGAGQCTMERKYLLDGMTACLDCWSALLSSVVLVQSGIEVQ